MIPKIIHYCWFGRNPKPEIIQKCIASWKKYCPDWEIKEWNEDNFDVTSTPYMKEAYERKKWAFVSDVARLMIIYKYGGFYLDTDVELFAKLEDLINYDAVFAFETELNINTGLGFGAVPKNPVVKSMIDYYNNKHFVINGKVDMTPCVSGNTESLKSCYCCFKRNGCTQIINNTIILSPHDYFKFAKHHSTATWVEKAISSKTNKYRDTRLKRFLRKEKLFNYVEMHFGQKGLNMYSFFAYDILEFGVFYFIRRKLWRKKQ